MTTEIESDVAVVEKNINDLESLETEIDLKRSELEDLKKEIEEARIKPRHIPMREIDEEEMILVKRQSSRSEATAGLKAKIEKQKAYDNVKVTGKFINRFKPGQPAKFVYQKYEDDPVRWYTFEDGKVYTLPRGFVDQINGGTESDPMYYKPVFIQKEGAQEPSEKIGENSTIAEVDTTNKRFSFVPVNF